MYIYVYIHSDSINHSYTTICFINYSYTTMCPHIILLKACKQSINISYADVC
jgi:hypothetical protein